MTFASPWMLLTLLAIPAAILLFRLAERRRMRYAVAFTNLSVLASVVGKGRSWRRHVPTAFFLLALGALCVALARPHRITNVTQDKATVILVVDVSGSMQATDVAPTRLGAAQNAVREFVKRVPKNVKLGLIAFSGEADVAAAPSTNREDLLISLDALGGYSGYGGTAIGDALAAAVDLGRAAVQSPLAAVSSAPTKGLVSILFLSDGSQNRGQLQPSQGAQLAKQAGIPVYTVALGTPNGTLPPAPGGYGPGGQYYGGGQPRRVPPDPATLRMIANTTGGKFVNATSSSIVNATYSHLGSQLGRKRSNTEITSTFLGLAALLLIAGGVLSALWSPRLP